MLEDSGTAEVQRVLDARLGPGQAQVEADLGFLARVRFPAGRALETYRAACDDLGFGHCSMVGAIDWVAHREVFVVAWSDARRCYLWLSTQVPASAAHLESATAVWPSAGWHEREAWEMVGVEFDHHPDLRHLLLPDGYAFQPLLRSFKLHEPEELEVKSRHV